MTLVTSVEVDMLRVIQPADVKSSLIQITYVVAKPVEVKVLRRIDVRWSAQAYHSRCVRSLLVNVSGRGGPNKRRLRLRRITPRVHHNTYVVATAVIVDVLTEQEAYEMSIGDSPKKHSRSFKG